MHAFDGGQEAKILEEVQKRTGGSINMPSPGGRLVTPSVLYPKQTTKPCHEHHVYMIKHVINCVDQFLIT